MTARENNGSRTGSGFSLGQLIDGGFFGQDGEHWRKSRSGLRAEDEFSLGVVELEVSVKNPNGEYSEELGIQVEPRENSGLEIGISKSSVLMAFEAVENEVT